MLTECFTVLQRSKDTIRNVFEYDENFRKIRESYTSSSNVIIQSWNYDERGNVIQEKSELLKAPPTRIFTIEQDGTRTKEVMDSNPDDNRNYQIEYAYNDLNQKTGEVKSHLDGRIQYDLTYEYNQNGDVISESYLNLKKENGERSKIRIVYEYDSYLNWIKKRSYYEEQLEQSETRTIEYY